MLSLKFPLIIPKLEKNNSLYHGPFSKGEFISPLPTLKALPTSQNRSKLKLQEDITPTSSIRPTVKLQDNESEFISHPKTHRQGSLTPAGVSLLRLKENATPSNGLSPLSQIRHKSTPKLLIQPGRQGSLTGREISTRFKKQNDSHNFTKLLVDDLLRDRNQEVLHSNVKTYLKFLQCNNQDSIDIFASKLRKQSGVVKVHEADLHNESSEVDKYWLEGMFEKEQNPSTKTKLNGKSQVGFDTCSTPSLPGKRGSRKIPTNQASKTELDLTPNNRRNALKVRKSTKVLTPEEMMAKELSDTVTNNYEIYCEHAIKIQDLRHRVDDYLSSQGVTQIFSGKGDDEQYLCMRIFKDMLEVIEIPTPALENPSILYHSKKIKTKHKLIPEKYLSYKKVNKELEDINLEFKVREVQYVEADLRKAHGDFVSKKHEILTRVAKTSLNKYVQLKGQCEGVENIISEYNSFPLHDDGKKDPLGEPTLNMRINKRLEEFMTSWKKDMRDFN